MNKSGKFKGVGKVFKFTFAQNACAKGFGIVTAIIGIILMAAVIFINVIAAQKDTNDIKNVVIADNSGFEGFNQDELKKYNSLENIEYIDDISFELIEAKNEDKLVEYMNNSDEAANTVGILISRNKEKLKLASYILSDGEIDKEAADNITEFVSGYYNQLKFVNSKLTPEQLMIMLTPVSVMDSQIDEDTDIVKTMVKIFAPMICALLMYMMLLFYGQTISKIIISEKTSKLMEYILTSVKADALIAGKILAMVTLAICQVFLWVICLVVGCVIGNEIGKSINPEYKNIIWELIKSIKEMSDGALTIQSLIMAFVAFIIGFLFYAVLAGLVASFIQKAESMAQVMLIYQYTVIAGFLVAYMGSFIENKTLIFISNYIPIFSPFTLSANILTGLLSPIEIVISGGILTVACVLLVVLTAKIYRSLVLFNGVKITPAVIREAIKS